MKNSTIHTPILTKEKPARRRRKAILLSSVAVLLVVALAAAGVHFALSSAEQKKHVAALESTLASQSAVLNQQQSTLDEQSKTLGEQSKTLEENSKKLEEQQNTIKDQETKIKQQESTISDLNKQLVAKKNSQTSTNSTKPTTATQVKVEAPDVSHLGGKKLVALTFDDGPGPYTERLLDAMKQRGGKATFFVLGTRVNSYASTLKRIAAEGHEIGNHSNDHPQLTTLSASGIKSNMNACASKVKAILGVEPTVMRCPYGSFNNNVKSYAAGKKIPIIQWSVDTEDWRYSSWSSASATDKILSNSFKSGAYGIHDGSIVLMHDIHKNSVDAAIAMMDKLIDQGYTLVTVSELLAAREGSIVAGKVYY